MYKGHPLISELKVLIPHNCLVCCPSDESSRKQLKLCCEESSPPPLDRKFEDAENPLDSSADEMDTGEGSPLAGTAFLSSCTCTCTVAVVKCRE